jgi:protein SCO1/2
MHLRIVTSTAVACAVAAVLLSGCGRHPALTGHVPQNLAPVGNVTVPEVAVGRSSTRYALHAAPGKLLIVYFGYAACPDVCPTTMTNLRSALTRLGDDAKRVEFAFITVDPARDSAGVVARYVASFLPDGHALRPPDQTTLAAAERAFGARASMTRDLQGKITVSHTPLCYVVDDGGRILLEWDSGATAANMAADLRVLLSDVPR